MNPPPPPTTPPDPDWCRRCPQRSARSLGAEWLCNQCAETILAPIRDNVTSRDPFGGRGRQVGPRRLDYGPDWANLECDRCAATWVGHIGETCDWCAHSYELLIEVQRSVLLNPELPDIDSSERRRAECAWAERLGRAVAAGIVPRDIAHRALQRELAKTA